MIRLPENNPLALIVVGFFLVLAGMVFPWLMVLKVIESTFLLNFFSFAASFTGLMLGIVGAAFYARANRK
jgi:hypothetical protein